LKMCIELGVKLPLLLYFALLNVGGLEFKVQRRIMEDRPKINMSNNFIISSPIEITNYHTPAYVFLRQIFDEIWQCAGFSYSLNYDNNGVWVGQSKLYE